MNDFVVGSTEIVDSFFFSTGEHIVAWQKMDFTGALDQTVSLTNKYKYSRIMLELVPIHPFAILMEAITLPAVSPTTGTLSITALPTPLIESTILPPYVGTVSLIYIILLHLFFKMW